MKTIKTKLKLKENATPKFHRPRTVPFALRGAVEQELNRLEEKGILKKVSHSEWAAPIVPVPKKDGTVRVCGDYKVTVNPSLDVDQYPLPKPEDLFATLANGKSFSKLDLSQAYQQMVLEEKSAECLTVNTHLGSSALQSTLTWDQLTRLPFSGGLRTGTPVIVVIFLSFFLHHISSSVHQIFTKLVASGTITL